jgi:hypothetical protein
LPEVLSVLAGDPLDPADERSRGSVVTAPVVAAVPGVIAFEPETVEPEPVAVGRSDPPPEAPDGGVETCACATPDTANATKTAPTHILSMSCLLRALASHTTRAPNAAARPDVPVSRNSSAEQIRELSA